MTILLDKIIKNNLIKTSNKKQPLFATVLFKYCELLARRRHELRAISP